MDRELLEKLAKDLREMEDFLNDCDDGLAWEVSAKDGIGGRICRGAEAAADLRRKAEALAAGGK